MSVVIPPSPIDAPFASSNWVDWYEKVRRAINAGGTITWSQITSFNPGGILPVSLGGTGSATPTLTGGTNISVTGTWPNQTVTCTLTNAATATKLQTARLIGGTSFDGTANIAVALASTATTLATPRAINGINFDGSAPITINAVDATARVAKTGDTMSGQLAITSGVTATPSAVFITGGPNQGQVRFGNNTFIQGGDDYVGLNITHGATTLFYIDTTANTTFGGASNAPPIVTILGNNTSRPVLRFNNGVHTWNTALKSDAGQDYYMIANPAETVGVYMTPAASGWNNLSDERAKENWLPITDAVVKLEALDVGTFSWVKDPTLPRDVGIKAQQVLTVQPEAVDTSNPEAFGVRYTHLVPILIKAVQELSARITELEAHIAKE